MQSRDGEARGERLESWNQKCAARYQKIQIEKRTRQFAPELSSQNREERRLNHGYDYELLGLKYAGKRDHEPAKRQHENGNRTPNAGHDIRQKNLLPPLPNHE